MTYILKCVLDISITGAVATVIVCIARLVLRLFGDRSGSAAKRVMWLAVMICFLFPMRITLPYYENAGIPVTGLTQALEEQGNHDIAADTNTAEINWGSASTGLQANDRGQAIQKDESSKEYFANAENKIVSTIIRTDLSGLITSRLSGRTSAMILAAMVTATAIVILFGVVQYNRLLEGLAGSVRREDGVWISSRIASPCTVGFINPQIYLPKNISSANAECAVLHERAHIRCHDNIIKPIVYLAFAFNIFNPFAWLMLRLFYADMESHCDAIAVRGLTQNKRIDYCKALVDYASGGGAAIYSTFGGVSIKRRINSVMLKKRAPIVITAAVTAVALMLCGCITLFTANRVVALSDITESGEAFPKEFSNVSTVRISCQHGVALLTDDEDISAVFSYLRELKVYERRISASRSEDRDNTVRVAFISGSECVGDVNISADYDEIYFNDHVKPSFSYRVADSDGLKAKILEYTSNLDNCRYTPAGVMWSSPYSSASGDYFFEIAQEAEYTLSTDFTASSTSGYITTDHIENARYEPIEVGDRIYTSGVEDEVDESFFSIDISKYASVSAYRLYDGGRIMHIIYCLDDEIWVSSWMGNNVTANVENPLFSCNHIFTLVKAENPN